MQISIDVIVPAYLPNPDNLHLLNRALKSLEAQTYQGFHTYIVLNGLYDNEQVVRSSIQYKNDHTILSLPGKASGAIARNCGIRAASSPLIAQIDADDQYHPQKLEKQVSYMEKNEEVGILGTLAWDYYKDGTARESCFRPGQYETNGQIIAALAYENVMCHSSVMFRRTALDLLGGYVEEKKPGTVWPEYGTKMWEDWDLWLRAVSLGIKLHNLPERLYYWSVGTGVER